jgi:MraZ protein
MEGFGTGMLLTGFYHRSVDDKLRVAIPRELRNSLCGDDDLVLYVTPGWDGSLGLFTEEVLNRLARRLNKASPTAVGVRSFTRLFYAQAQRVEADGQGRIRLPNNLATAAGITREAVILGVRDHLEIWDKTRWEEFLNQCQPRYDELAEQAFNPGATRAKGGNPDATSP